MIGAATIVAAALLAATIPPPKSSPPNDSPIDNDEPTRPGEWLEKFPGPREGFLIRLQSLCADERYAGEVVTADPQDEAMQSEHLVLGPADCTIAADGRMTKIALPVAMGNDRSRTWILEPTPTGVSLRHRHSSEDGSEAAVTGYGGVAEGGGTFTRQAFPADAESRALFEENGLRESTDNVWAIEITPGDRFAYELTRPDRKLRIEFDLADPLPK